MRERRFLTLIIDYMMESTLGSNEPSRDNQIFGAAIDTFHVVGKSRNLDSHLLFFTVSNRFIDEFFDFEGIFSGRNVLIK